MNGHSAHLPALHAPAPRDLRVDALRGAALIWIFVDHVRGNFFARLTYQQFGLSTGAWLFVLLSGLSFALKYSRMLTQTGLRASMLSGLDRVRTLYFAHLVSFTLAIGLWATLADAVGNGPEDLKRFEYLAPLIEQPFVAIPKFLTLSYQPQFFDILPMYMVLVAVGPLLLWSLRRAPLWTYGLSLAVYLCAQVAPVATNLPAWHRPSGWTFHVLAWQLLFLIGLTVGAGMVPSWRSDRQKKWVLASAFSWVVFSAACRVCAHIDAVHDRLGGAGNPFLVKTEKLVAWGTTMHPLTVLHVLAVVVVLNALVPRDGAITRSPWLRPLIDMGANSLEVFIAGIILSGLCSVLFTLFSPSLPVQLAINLAAIVLMWLVARGLVALKRATRPVKERSSFPAGAIAR